MNGTTKRLYYIDWLRVFAMLAIFLFHADRFFDFYGWHVKNPETNLFSTVHISFFSIWLMPLFFVLSGASIYFSLQVRTTGAFIKERLKRILLPFVLIGYLVTSPPQSYLDRLTNGKFSGSFTDYLPYYFQGFDIFGGNFPWHGFHLWYLLYLFILSFLLLPLFVTGKKSSPSILTCFSRNFENPWRLLLLPLPIIAANVLVDLMGIGFIRATGGWSIFSYLFFLLYGALVFSNQAVLSSLQRIQLMLLTSGIVSALVLMIVYFGMKPEISEKTPLLYLLLTTIKVTCSLSWIGAFIGSSEKYLNFTNKVLAYTSQAVLPFYILHQLYLLLVGYYIVQWQVNAFVKFLAIAAIAFLAIMFSYEFIIRRVRVLRFLFGMKARRKSLEK